jgi:excinuclease ABC subunit C
VLIDGGKGQLSAAHDALDALRLGTLSLISLAKREEEIFMVGRSDSLRLPRRSPALRVLQQARDEAHRFAITFQRKRRAMRTVTSELLRIPGVGDRKRRQLLEAFGSLEGVRTAAPEAIAALPGFSLKSAAKIQAALNGEAAPAPDSSQREEPENLTMASTNSNLNES